MTTLLEGAKKLVTRSSGIGARVEGLDRAVTAARGRVDDALVDDVAKVVDRAAGRLKLSANHTVVALAGATGSGKSSTFNALTELELSAVGVRRPTTSWATACVWGKDGAEELLAWLGIPPRHQVTRDSMLSQADDDSAMQGVVLLDLPDHDSTEVAHHLEVERLVELADMLVWVLDPQKYADAAIHDRFLKPLAGHSDVMLVVLNHIDTVPENRRQPMVEDVRRLLEADGLTGVPVIPVSARQGWGVDELRALVVKRVSEKKATRARLEADVQTSARRLQEAVGTGKAPSLSNERIAALNDSFADAAGVPTVVKAVADSTRLRANRATGWPVTAWFSKLKPDPLKRLHLNLRSAGRELSGVSRTSVPTATGIQKARVDTEVRSLADQVGEDLPPAWATAVRAASVSRLPDLTDGLDRAVASTDLGADRIPIWAGLVRVLQYLLIVSAVIGAAWLGVLAFGSYARLPEPPTPEWRGLPVPTLLLIGGVLAGLLLALVCRGLVALTAKSRAASANRRLRAAISEVSEDVVVAPIRTEIARCAEAREGLAVALR